MKAKIIKTEAEYDEALKRIEVLMDAAPGSPEEDELDLPELEPCVICERFHPDSDCVACLRTCFLCFRHFCCEQCMAQAKYQW